MSRTLLLTSAAALVMLVTSSTSAFAQAEGGTITGRVALEATGDPIHGAAVIVIGARRTAVTDEDGRFAIEDVPPGTYEIIAQREHLTADRQTVTVATDETAVVDFVVTIEAAHEQVTVTASATGTATAFDSFNAVSSLDSAEILKNVGVSVADALQNEPGVSVRSFGPGSGRPIIRGFDGDRVLIMQDGMRTGDLSSQSGDHGVSIDAAGLERIEVVKGPATLLYGSNAIGGVVNAITPQDAFRASPFEGLLGGITLDTGSVNAQAGGSATVQWGRGGWTVWGSGSGRRSGDYNSAIGRVENSATRLVNGRAGLGWVGSQVFLSVGGQVERSRFGVPFAGELHGHQHGDEGEEEHADDAEEEHVDIGLESRRHELRVDTGLQNLTNAFVDTVKLTVSAVSYEHDEVEVVEDVETIGTQFDNATRSLRLELGQRRIGSLGGRLGIEWFGRDFAATGEEALAPETTQQALSAFAYEEWGLGRVRLQFGGRVERTAYDTGERPEGILHHHDDEEEAGGGTHEPPPVRDRTFTGASGSFGVHADVGGQSALVANVTTATRAPSLEELYNFGPHVGNAAFEVGNADLAVEQTLGLDVSVRTRSARASGELNLFVYDIDDFVYFDVTGDQVGGLREAEVTQGDGRFLGAEATGTFELGGHVHASAGLSVVRATLTSTGEPLPRIPPFSAHVELEVPWRQLTIAPEVVLTAAQRRVFRDETTTGGYALFNLGASWSIVRSHTTHLVTFRAHNLTNTDYRSHTSFLKEFAPEPGRGIKLAYTVKFF